MSFQDTLKQIDQLQYKIEAYGKFNYDMLNKINYKFRLDWNYYSNRMEGNTLTIEETKSVMIGNINVRNKPIKDVMEMKGHDEAIQTILKMGKGELNISESRIKELHNAIMHEDTPSEKEKIGKWKTQNNHIYNYKDEKFDFADLSEVPDRMHELINWLNAEKDKINHHKKDAIHPVQLAFEFHLKYLTIHPFYDGNGRTGRILTNLILISYGYPPVYIKENDKKVYYRTLADVQAYGADPFLLYDIMADYLVRSLNIVIDALEGREIEEPEDLDKKLQLLEAELNIIDPEDEIKQHFSKDVFWNCYETWISKLVMASIPVIQKFNKFFTEPRHNIYVKHSISTIYFSNEPISEISEKLKESIIINLEKFNHSDLEFDIHSFYRAFKKSGLNVFGCNYSICIKFEDTKYTVEIEDFDEATEKRIAIPFITRLLHKPVTEEEINDIVQRLGNTIFKHIDFYTKKNGLR